MRKIKDERLIMQNLKNIRIAFLVQTVGIIAVLVYQGVTEGIMNVFGSPLWFVLMITIVTLGWLNLRISVDVYDNAHNQKEPGPYYRIVIIALLVGFVLALLTKFGPDKSENLEAFIVGAVVFICFLIPFSFVHFLRKKRIEDVED